MATRVRFGINYSDNNVLTKHIEWDSSSVDCKFYESVDRLNPRIIVDNDTIDISNCVLHAWLCMGGFCIWYF